MILVDTGAWFASVVPADPNHVVARMTFAQLRERPVITDFIFDETLTLLVTRARWTAAVALGELMLSGGACDIVRIQDADFTNAWQLFRRFADKNWSFTDCTSYVVMQRLGITTAFSFDQHFRQFGTVAVVP